MRKIILTLLVLPACAWAGDKFEVVQLHAGNYVYCKANEHCDERTTKYIAEPLPQKSSVSNIDRAYVYFDLAKTQLRQTGKDTVSLLINNKKIRRIRIVGHTDQVGSRKLNERLARSRAESVAKYIAQHIEPSLIEVESECCIEHPPINNHKARRVEIIVESM